MSALIHNLLRGHKFQRPCGNTVLCLNLNNLLQILCCRNIDGIFMSVFRGIAHNLICRSCCKNTVTGFSRSLQRDLVVRKKHIHNINLILLILHADLIIRLRTDIHAKHRCHKASDVILVQISLAHQSIDQILFHKAECPDIISRSGFNG